VRKHFLFTASLALLVSLAGACAQQDQEILEDEGTAIEWPTTQHDRIWIEGRSTVAPGAADAVQAGDGDGACACSTAECFHQWVVDNLGCDICVAFVCDGDTVAHSCMACDDDSIHPGEGWDGDGQVQ
jgi:hypothetical protein